MSMKGLRAHYLAYIATLNERRFEDLTAFVADELVYNGAHLTGGQYHRLRLHPAGAVPGLVAHRRTREVR